MRRSVDDQRRRIGGLVRTVSTFVRHQIAGDCSRSLVLAPESQPTHMVGFFGRRLARTWDERLDRMVRFRARG